VGAEGEASRMTFIMGNGTLITDPAQPRVIVDGGVAWQRDRITQVGPEAALRKQYPDATYLDARGGIILPGLINVHHHFYSALARGLDPGTPMANFAEVLDRLWWRLDRALDADTVRLSAELCAAECIRHGCTTVFDHHSSPGFIDGSLDTIAAAIVEAGLSAVLCYEVTDRNGAEGAAAGIEENLRFMQARRDDSRIRGVFGLHASFTLRDETLKQIAERRPADGGCHVHVAEDPVDVEETVRLCGVDPVTRLERHGLLDSRALLAHCIHLDSPAYSTIARNGAAILHNPESNANNGVGRLDVAKTAAQRCLVGLGTDGMSSSMLRALRYAFLSHRAARRDPNSGFDALPHLPAANVNIARRFFDEPALGELRPGAPADLISIDAVPPTPLYPGNVFGHFVYGASEYPVRHTVARGEVLLEDHRHTTVDPTAIAAEASDLSPALWERFHALDWGTSHLG